MKNKTQLIAEFLYDGNHKRFESFAESSAIAYEHFVKKYPQKKFSFSFFNKVYNAVVSNRIKRLRVCRISDLFYGTYFSFKKKGKVFVAGDRFIRPSKKNYVMSLHYFGVTTQGHFHGHIKYPLLVANSRCVFLHDLDNAASRKIAKTKILQKYEL